MPFRSDFITVILTLAAQRYVAASAPTWRTLPLDVVRIIFGYLRVPSKANERVFGAAEFVWANAEAMWAHVRRTKRGVRVVELVESVPPRFRWEALGTPAQVHAQAQAGAQKAAGGPNAQEESRACEVM